MTDVPNPAWTLFTRNRHLLILSIGMLAVAGATALSTLPRIEDPRITTRNATIITAYPGASATRVEALVSKKIEDRLRELSEIKDIESTSRNGISVVTVELQDWVTARENEQVFSKVRDRLDDAAVALPAGAGPPTFDDKRGAVAFSMIVALDWLPSGDTELGILNRQAERLADLLRNLPGTEQVVLFGAAAEEIQVDVDAAELAALGMTTADVAARVAAADARRSAGMLRHADRDLPLELRGALDSIARVGAVPLAANDQGSLISLADIASIRKDWADPPEQIALHNGERSVLVAVRTEDGVRLDHWAEEAHAKVALFRSVLDPGVQLATVFDQSRYTEARLGSLAVNLLAGAAVVVVVVLFMMGWRPALIVGAALPLSTGATLFGLGLFGEQIHQMSIFGMIIAIGLLIDNAIVMTDSVVARRRAGASATEAVSGAVQHLFSPLFASTFTTVLGFLPIFLLPGNVGDFVRPIATAVVLALIASFVLAMSVIPALAGLLAETERRTGHRWWRDGVQSEALTQGYRGLLRRALRRPATTLVLTAMLPFTGFLLAGGLGMQFFPPADRDQLEVQVWMPSSTGIHHTARRLHDIEAAIREHAGVAAVTWVAGASSPPVYYNQLREQDNHPAYARGIIKVADAAMAKSLEGALQQQLTEGFRDTQVVVRAFGQGPPITAPIGFRIVGPETDQLRRLGERLRALLHRHPDVTTTRASIVGGEPKLWFAADEHAARLAGLTLGDIAAQFQAALDGRIGGRVLEDLEDLPVRIRYAPEQRGALDQASTLRLRIPRSDTWIPANALGQMALRPEPARITRRNGERVNHIHGFLRQGTLPIEVTRAVQSQLDAGDLSLPPGYRVELAGDSAEQQRAIGQLLAHVPVLATLMIGSLVLSFGSFALAGLIAVVAVSALGLGLLSLWVSGYPIGFNPIIGSAGLVGVAINGSIVVLAAIRGNPRARRGEAAAIIDETVAATRHILSTTLTTIAGFMPLLVFSGGDFWPPLAVVIAGGVGLSGLLSLLLTPAAYLLMQRRRSAPVGAWARSAP
ncbi:MAG: efflux RND transporter permease subunit [Chromatiaceae bacterium]|jgi:multidrug efflux pump subunit AcrB